VLVDVGEREGVELGEGVGVRVAVRVGVSAGVLVGVRDGVELGEASACEPPCETGSGLRARRVSDAVGVRDADV